MFILGIIVGILLSIIAFMVGLQARMVISGVVEKEVTPLKLMGIKKRGSIYEAPLDIDIARQEIVDRNRSEGRQTKVEDLM